nr:hypothetical protein [Planococcus glaciei]
MEINYVEESDLLRCTDVFIEVFNSEPWNDEWKPEKAKQYLLDFYHTPGFLGLVALEGEEVIGFSFSASIASGGAAMNSLSMKCV